MYNIIFMLKRSPQHEQVWAIHCTIQCTLFNRILTTYKWLLPGIKWGFFHLNVNRQGLTPILQRQNNKITQYSVWVSAMVCSVCVCVLTLCRWGRSRAAVSTVSDTHSIVITLHQIRLVYRPPHLYREEEMSRPDTAVQTVSRVSQQRETEDTKLLNLTLMSLE